MTEPTGAELDTIDIDAKAIANQNPIGTPFAWRKAYLAAFARAVLAKWGTPPAVAERLEVTEAECEAAVLEIEIEDLRTAPQPTQAQAGAVPLTNEQAASLCKMGPVYAPDGQVVRTPEQYRRELEGAKLAGIRTAERAHGIKGGQHGTE